MVTNGLAACRVELMDQPFKLNQWKKGRSMNYFLNNPQTQKPLSDEELMALALENKEKAKAQQKKKEMKGCGCCPVDPP